MTVDATPFISPAEANEASTFLIVGGLIVLGVVLALVVLRSVLPMAPPERGDRRKGALGRELRRAPDLPDPPAEATNVPLSAADLERGRRAAREFGPRSVEEALDHAVRSGWAEPRIIDLAGQRTILRYYRCEECERGRGARTDAPGCGFNAGYLLGAFEHLERRPAHVREVACRRQGAAVCEFEVSSA
jgi:V4R domain-containing protein